MKIGVIGTGYVGLVTGACLSNIGHDVTCIDINEEKINKLNRGISPIYEPGLDDLLTNNINENRLHFTTNIKDCINDIDVVFCAVGTPPDEDGSADLSYVIGAASQVGQLINKKIVFVTKSTVPVGTSEKVYKAISNELKLRNLEIDFAVASNPEFLKEGSAIDDFSNPERIVIGTDCEYAKECLTNVYNSPNFKDKIIYTNIKSAEMIKYASNAMLATRISFMNEIANLCEKVGADVEDVKLGMGTDSRIGSKFLNAGCGYGGSCFPKDVKALVHTGKENHSPLTILEAVEDVNLKQKRVPFDKVVKFFNDDLYNKTVAIWGLAFKPNTDDMREAPSIKTIQCFLGKGCYVRVYDPIAMDECKRIMKDQPFNQYITYCDNMYDCAENANVVVLLTEWDEFKDVHWSKIHTQLVMDGRNLYTKDVDLLNSFNINYLRIG